MQRSLLVRRPNNRSENGARVAEVAKHSARHVALELTRDAVFGQDAFPPLS